MSTTFLLRLLAVLVALAVITSGILISFASGQGPQKALGILLVPLGILSLIVTGKVQFRRITNND